MSQGLKPCPFCGGEAESDANQSFRAFVSGTIEDAVAVYCLDCGAQISICVPDVPGITIEQVVGMWNARAESAEIATLRAQVVALTEDLAESDAIRDKCARLLAETAVALKGPEKALHRHGWQDLPECAAKLTAALGKAREALWVVHHHNKLYHGETHNTVTQTCEALAAIDGVLGQKAIFGLPLVIEAGLPPDQVSILQDGKEIARIVGIDALGEKGGA